MSCDCQSAGAGLCACCSGVTRETPAPIANRPSLPALAYRVGNYSSFRASMQAALAGSDVPALAGLRTRDSGDFSIALVDAWSETLDILTFYTERLANEAYLTTAIEGRSVFELARLVGYKPSPGVSAATVLAFTLATAPGSPAIVPLPAGTRVQSVPGPGQTPQVFETSAALTACIANNAIPAATAAPWQVMGGDTSAWIAGTANNIQVGNVLLFVNAPNGIPSGSGPGAMGTVTAVSVDAAGGNTWVSWDTPLPGSFQAGDTAVCLYVLRIKAALYGANAPQPGLFATSTLNNIPPFSPTLLPPVAPNPVGDWPWQYSNSLSVNLDGAFAGLNPAGTGTAAQLQWAVFTGAAGATAFQIASATESNPALYALSSKTSQLTLRATAIPLAGGTGTDAGTQLQAFVDDTRSTTVYVQSQLLTLAPQPLTTWSVGTPYPLTPGMLVPVCGSACVLAGLQPIADNAAIGLSGRRVRIAPQAALNGSAAGSAAGGGPAAGGPAAGGAAASAGVAGGFTPAGATGALPVSTNQPFLVDAFPPQADGSIAGNLLWSVITVTGQPGTLSVPSSVGAAASAGPGYLLQPAANADPVVGEAAIVAAATVNGATTALTFTAELGRIYDTAGVAVNANAIEATHGETTREIMGSGDATNATLSFQLKQSPLTYTSAAVPGGVQSTLQVRVNNLLWTEVPNFLSSAPGDRVYVTRPNSAGGPTVQFGDGIGGSRTPTGTSNIQALYRKGIGIAGMVAAGQLTQPLDRPQGLQTVTNPGPASGGADPATPADARQSAPLPTLTLGRVVSLEDYQNFALGFAGISMALATWTWFGNRRGIFLTLAGEGGRTLDAGDPVVLNLLQAYQTYGLPNMPVLPASYVPQNFEIGMQVRVDTPTYDPAAVIPQVWRTLAAAFAFGNLAPGQSVAASRVIQIAQQVAGVTAIDLTALQLSGETAGVATLLCAAGPNVAGSPPTGAQVLLLDPASQGNVEVWS